MTRKRLTGLSSEAYEHPFDRKALASLERVPGMSLLFKKINEFSLDRLLKMQCNGCNIRVTAQNFPNLYEALVETCQTLDLTPIPELYLSRGTGFIHTYTIGVEKAVVGMNLEAMEWLVDDELLFILGHEVAHIKSHHLLYHQTAVMLPAFKGLLSSTTLGLGGIATSGIELTLYNWLMMANLTSDRAGLLACQNVNAAITSLMKLAGLPGEYLTTDVIKEFQTQAREFDTKNFDNLDKFARMLSFMEHYHPWSVMRASELLKWIDSGEYDHLIQGTPIEEHKEAEGWEFLTSW